MTSGPQLARGTARAGAFLVAKLRALDEQVAAAAPRVVASEHDAEAVHDLRVALRRTRTVLEMGAKVLGRFRAKEVRRELRDVQRATGDLRDEEVLLELLSSLGVAAPDAQAWIDGRRRRERRLRRALVRLLQAGGLDRGRRLLDALLVFPVEPSRDRRLSKLARRAVEQAQREVHHRGGAPLDDPEALHRLRIANKRLRYAAETFADALPHDLASLAQDAHRMQDRLGDLHDADVALGHVRRARSLSDEGRAELLAALERERTERAAKYAKDAGVEAPSPPDQAVGADSLRKISSR